MVRQSFNHFNPAVKVFECCGRRHQGECIADAGSCFRCGGIGHNAHNCLIGHPTENFTSGSVYVEVIVRVLIILFRDNHSILLQLLAVVLRVTE